MTQEINNQVKDGDGGNTPQDGGNPYAKIVGEELTPEQQITKLTEEKAKVEAELGKAQHTIVTLKDINKGGGEDPKKEEAKANPEGQPVVQGVTAEDVEKLLNSKLQETSNTQNQLKYAEELNKLDDANLRAAVQHVLDNNFKDEYKFGNPASQVVAEAKAYVLAIAGQGVETNQVTTQDNKQNQFGGNNGTPKSNADDDKSQAIKDKIHARLKRNFGDRAGE